MLAEAQWILQETEVQEEVPRDPVGDDQLDGQFFQAVPADTEAGEVVAGMITVSFSSWGNLLILDMHLAFLLHYCHVGL